MGNITISIDNGTINKQVVYTISNSDVGRIVAYAQAMPHYGQDAEGNALGPVVSVKNMFTGMLKGVRDNVVRFERDSQTVVPEVSEIGATPSE